MRARSRAKRFAGAVLAMLALGSPVLAQQRPPSLFTVANVKASADAANAVDAKKIATQLAETRAFRALLLRLSDYKSQARLPNLPPEQIERLVSNMDVRDEGVSERSYMATFGVTFSERSVVNLLRQYGVTPIVDRAPEILIVPVFVEDGAASTSDRNPWRSALAGLDLVHGQVPAKVAPTRGDLTAAIAKAYYANPAAAMETLKTQYNTPQILLALAETNGEEGVSVKLAGNDALGLFSLERKVKAEGDESAIKSAARLALDTLQDRWKLTRGGAPAVASATTGGYESSEALPSGTLAPVSVTAEFAGLKEWQTLRARLQSIPGVQNWDLKSVNPRAAEIGFDFPGGAEKLAAMAESRGLTVENGPEGLVVRSR